MLTFLWLNQQVGQLFLQSGLVLYGLFVCGLLLLLAMIAAAVPATALSGERERRTYELLLVTAASPAGIVLGKWLASVLYLLFLAAAALPLLAVVYLFGGVPLAMLGKALLLSFFTGLGYGAVGLAYSALVKRSQAAVILSVITVFAFVFGTLIIAGIVAASQSVLLPGPEPPPAREPGWYVYLSPLSALPNVLPQHAMVIPIVGELTRAYYGESCGLTVAVEGPSAPAWFKFALYQSALTVISLLIATLAVNPLPPWRRWQLQRRGKSRAM